MYQRNIVVVEDDDLLRSLLADSLERAGFRVTTAANAADARRAIHTADPDAVVLDIDLGQGPNGFDIAETLRRDSKDVGIVFLTTVPDPRFMGKESKQIPKNEAYVNKSLISESKIIIDALEAVLRESDLKDFRHHEIENRPLGNLSNTQVEIIKLLSEGKTNQQIAELRERSLGSTESMIARTLEALGIQNDKDVNGRVAAVRKYLNVVRPTD
jgi:DNA-binding NarL/FixJ family response regulator